jgi:D-lactate dehydrogenase
MKISFYSSQPYDITFFEKVNAEYKHELIFHEYPLNEETVELVKDVECICVFVNDKLTAAVLKKLYEKGVRLIALRCAGFNNVDLNAADQLGITVVRVPAYSPESVAEHTTGLMLSLSRHIHRAYNRVRESNFSLNGLLGFELHHATVGIVGTGQIGTALAKILTGFGSRVIACDPVQNDECVALGVDYVDFKSLCQQADVISLHCPLTPQTQHLINRDSLQEMKKGIMIINTSRGAVVDTEAVIDSLKEGHIGYLGLDVYEQEENLFFKDLSDEIISDDLFERLLTFPNVLVTAHQAFFTQQALNNIAETTLTNIQRYENNDECLHCCHI